jgi:O-antigen/teichoic acid export membrane protein
VADAWRHDDQKRIQQLYSRTSLNQLIIGGFLFMMLWVNIDLLLSFLPTVYQQARWVIFIIGTGKLFDMATGINGEIISVSKHVKVGLITNLFLIAITTVANYLLIPVYGMYGAAAATALSMLVYNVIRMAFLYYEYRLQPFTVNTIKSIALLLICFGVYYVLPSTGNIWIRGIYQSVVLSAVFITPLLIFKISPEINAVYGSALLIFTNHRRNVR